MFGFELVLGMCCSGIGEVLSRFVLKVLFLEYLEEVGGLWLLRKTWILSWRFGLPRFDCASYFDVLCTIVL